MTTTPTPRRRPHRPARMILRPLPYESPLSRTWAGTKMICLAALTTVLLIEPTWATLAILAVLLTAASLAGRVPLSAVPRAPLWFWSGMFGGLIGAGITGVESAVLYVRLCLVGTVALWGSGLMMWTTPTSEMTPAIRTLISPLRRLGLPVDEWALVMGMTVRSLPVTRAQTRAVADTHTLRGVDLEDGARGVARSSLDVLTASLSGALRASADTGRAISLRGGTPPVRASRPRLGVGDAVLVALTALACVGALLVP